MTLFNNQEKSVELTSKDFELEQLNLNYIKPEPSPVLRSSKFDYLLAPENQLEPPKRDPSPSREEMQDKI